MLLLDLMQKGGPLMWVLLACSILAIGVFLERAFFLHRATIPVGDILKGLANLVAGSRYAEAIEECSATAGPVARVIHAVLLKHELDRAELRDIAQDAGQLEVPKLERNLGMLAALAYGAPLVGLLGTVVGLMQAFAAVSAHGGYATAAELADGVYQSLLTTAGGLGVSVVSFVAYSYLSARTNDLIHDIERAGIEIVMMIHDARDRRQSEEGVPS